MDRPAAGGFLSLTGLWPEGCGGGCAASFIKKGRGSVIGHTFGVRVQRVQRVRPAFGRLVQRVVDCPSGDEYKVSVTGLTFSVIWQNNHSADWLAALATPYPGCAGLPPVQGAE